MTALRRLARAIGLEPGEGRVFAWGAATFFLLGWAAVSLTNVSETFFLKRVGVGYLPLVFLVNSLLLAWTTSRVGRLAARAEHLRLLVRTFFLLAATLVPLWLLVVGDVRPAFVLLVIAAKQIESIALVALWIALGGLLHGRQGKRLYAPMMAGGTLGMIGGSFASGPLGRALGIASLLPVAALAFALAGGLAAALRGRAPMRVGRATGARAPRHDALPVLSALWREGGLFRLLVAGALLAGTLGPMLYFQFSYVADLATKGANGEQRLLDLYARFRGWINVGVLGLQLAGTARLFRTIGVPLAATLSPVVYLLGFLGLSVRLGLPAGVAAVAGVTLQDHAVYDPAQKVLVTLFRERVRPAVTTLVEGTVRRAGGALGNLIILAALALGTPAWVGYAGLPIAALWLVVTAALWRIYPTLLVEVARAGRGHGGDAPAFGEMIDSGTLRVLEASLADPDPQRCRAACALVVEGPPARAVEALARATRRAPVENRALLVEAVHRVLERGGVGLPAPDSARDLEALLAQPGALTPRERAHLVQAVARLRPDAAADMLPRWLDDPAEAVRLAAAAGLRRGTELDALLAGGLASEDAAAREVALEELRASLLGPDGAGRWEARVALLTTLLASPRERARAADALAAVAAQAGPRLASVGNLVCAHASDADPRVRAAVLRFVGHTRLEPHAAWVVSRLAADDDAEAAAAREAVHLLGAAAMPALLEALRSGKRATRDAVLPVLADLPLDVAALREVLDRELEAAARARTQLHALGAGRVSALVLQRLGERVDEGVHTALLLLATLRHEERIAVLGRLLARCAPGRGRAVLVEALEALLPPEESARVLPLLEERAPRALPPAESALHDTLADQDPLALTFLAATLDAETLGRAGGPVEVVPGQLAFDPTPAHALARGGDLSDDDARMLDRVEIVLQLRSLDLFARLTTRELTELAAVVREEAHAAGTTIVREGDLDDGMYVILSGTVRVTREDRFLARLGPREFFGEMALFDGATRAATVMAESRVRVLRLERNDLLQVMDEHPGIAIAICQTLSRRLREQNERGGGAAS